MKAVVPSGVRMGCVVSAEVKDHGRWGGCKQFWWALAGRYSLSFIYEATAAAWVMVARGDKGVVVLPTGIGSWSRGQGSRGWVKG